MTSPSKTRGFGILGGGFGLYGWLPAVTRCSDQPIRTLLRYRPTLLKRPELKRYLDRLVFVPHVDNLLAEVTTIVCAQRPADQVELVERCVTNQWRGNLVLEKPLAPSPTAAIQLLDAIATAGNGLAVGFSLQATAWSQELTRLLQAQLVDDVRIRWYFQAHHHRQDLRTWKRFPSEGGGVLRFYAIHLLAILANCGRWRVEWVSEANDLSSHIQVALSGNECNVKLDCDSNFIGQPCFEVIASKATRVRFTFRDLDPLPQLGESFRSDAKDIERAEDRRIPYLAKLLQTAELNNWRLESDIEQHVRLWAEVERASRDQKVRPTTITSSH